MDIVFVGCSQEGKMRDKNLGEEGKALSKKVLKGLR